MKEIEEAENALEISEKYDEASSVATYQIQHAQASALIAIAKLLEKLVDTIDNTTGYFDGETHIRVRNMGG